MGSVTKQGVTWQFVINTGLDGTGRRTQLRRRGFATRREAHAAMVEAQAAQLHGELVRPVRQSLAEFLAQWLAAVEPTLEVSAWTNYRTCLNRYVVPRLGGVQLATLTPLTLSRLYADLLRAGGRAGRPLSPTTVRLVHRVLRKALADAVSWGMLTTNPAARAAIPKRRRPMHVIWTPEHAAAFARAAAGDRLEAAWLLAMTAGLRRGELAGLRWGDVDLETATVSITSQRTTDAHYNIVTKEPKGTSRRNVAISPQIVDLLRQHRTRQLAERLAAGPAWSDTGLVFVTELGTGYHPQRLTDLFQQLVATTDLPRIRLHDLRHTAATLALVAGVHPKVVQERLGHASISMTLDLYSHVVAGLQRDAADAVQALLTCPQPRPEGTHNG